MVTKNISMRFQHSPIKTVGRVRKSAKKCTKMTSLSPVPVEPLFGRPWDLCPDATFSKMHIRERFREDRTSGKWSKKGNRMTDGRKSELLYLRCRWPQIKIENLKDRIFFYTLAFHTIRNSRKRRHVKISTADLIGVGFAWKFVLLRHLDTFFGVLSQSGITCKHY